MEQTECSETSAYKLQTPGNYPKESTQHTEHGESLKSWMIVAEQQKWNEAVFCTHTVPVMFRQNYTGTAGELVRSVGVRRRQVCGKNLRPTGVSRTKGESCTRSNEIRLCLCWCKGADGSVKRPQSTAKLYPYRNCLVLLKLALFRCLWQRLTTVSAMFWCNVLCTDRQKVMFVWILWAKRVAVGPPGVFCRTCVKETNQCDVACVWYAPSSSSHVDCYQYKLMTGGTR